MTKFLTSNEWQSAMKCEQARPLKAEVGVVLENKPGIKNSAELADVEERLSKKRAVELFDKGLPEPPRAGPFEALAEAIGDREAFTKGVDAGCAYEGYESCGASEL